MSVSEACAVHWVASGLEWLRKTPQREEATDGAPHRRSTQTDSAGFGQVLGTRRDLQAVSRCSLPLAPARVRPRDHDPSVRAANLARQHRVFSLAALGQETIHRFGVLPSAGAVAVEDFSKVVEQCGSGSGGGHGSGGALVGASRLLAGRLQLLDAGHAGTPREVWPAGGSEAGLWISGGTLAVVVSCRHRSAARGAGSAAADARYVSGGGDAPRARARRRAGGGSCVLLVCSFGPDFPAKTARRVSRAPAAARGLPAVSRVSSARPRQGASRRAAFALDAQARGARSSGRMVQAGGVPGMDDRRAVRGAAGEAGVA